MNVILAVAGEYMIWSHAVRDVIWRATARERESRYRGRKVGLSQPAGRRNRFPFLPHFLPAPSPARLLARLLRHRRHQDEEGSRARSGGVLRARGREGVSEARLTYPPARTTIPPA